MWVRRRDLGGADPRPGGGLALDDETIGAVVAALGCAPRPVAIDRARIDRHIRELALDRAAGRLDDAVHLDRLRAFRESKESLEVNASGALAWLVALAATWTDADVPEATADVLHAIYDQIVVTGRKIVSVRLTPSAYAHGLALALPTKVALGAPDRCWTRDFNLRHPDRGPG